MKVSTFAISALVVIAKVNAFVQIRNIRFSRDLPLFSGEEDLLRQEIADKNSLVKDEEKYALREVEGIEGALITESQADTDQSNDKKSLEARMARMTKLRAYPLFLAEKAAEIVEHAVDDVFRASDEYIDKLDDRREKIVVLGTGWGSASFLKDIDTTKYDVTVISPRNYFLFTPMLAGASVGTVEYRSITEPIREVSSCALADFDAFSLFFTLTLLQRLIDG